MNIAIDEPQKKLKTGTAGPLLWGFLIFIVLFGGVGTWLVLAELSGAVIASGTVSVLGKPKTIQHLDGGIVTEISVQNGDMVEEGALLVRLDDTVLISNLEIYESRLQEALAKRDRLRSEQLEQVRIRYDDKELIDLEIEADQNVRQGQENLFNARRSRVRGQVSQLEEKIEQFRDQTFGLSSAEFSKREQLSLLQVERNNLSSLAEQGFAAKNRVLALDRQISELNGQISGDTAELARIDNLVTETRIQIAQVRREFSESVVTELRDVESQVNDLLQQIKATREQLSRVDIVSPVSGVIHELSIFTIGGVVTPGAPILQVVPASEEMEFEINVEPFFIDQVYVDQPAAVVFSAFNARTTPQLEGHVIGISPDSIINQDLGTSFYRVKVGVSDDELARLGDLQLVPGMPVEVFLTTQQQSPLEYLIRPLTDNLKRAMREE
jgi:HlyD family secretion protein